MNSSLVYTGKERDFTLDTRFILLAFSCNVYSRFRLLFASIELLEYDDYIDYRILHIFSPVARK